MNNQLKDQLQKTQLKEGYINRKNGTFGFIRVYPPGQQRYDVFFHEKGLNVKAKNSRPIRVVEVGDKVTFEVEEDERGPVAVNIEIIEQNHNIKKGDN